MGCRELQYYFRDGANGNSAAHFEYSPFGKTTVASGTIPNRFAFRFSSEYHDSETNLVYYNYRYYSPELGRWLSRDPIGEDGGFNLYAMVGNDPVGRWDYLGQDWLDCIGKCIAANDPEAMLIDYLLSKINNSGLISDLANLLISKPGTAAGTILGAVISKETARQIMTKIANGIKDMEKRERMLEKIRKISDMSLGPKEKKKLITTVAQTLRVIAESKDKKQLLKLLKPIVSGGKFAKLVQSMSPGGIAYGLYMAYMESYCMALCCEHDEYKDEFNFFETFVNGHAHLLGL